MLARPIHFSVFWKLRSYSLIRIAVAKWTLSSDEMVCELVAVEQTLLHMTGSQVLRWFWERWFWVWDQDNHDGVITHLEPDILECEGKWALESITTNKASGGDGIPVVLFQILMLWKCCTQYASKFGKLSSGHRTGKRQLSFQSQRRAMPKNAQTTAQLHSSHTLVK